MKTEVKWEVGDRFTKLGSLRQYRVHRVKGRAVWYLPAHYGAHPPRGVVRRAGPADRGRWNYTSGLPVTHEGVRVELRGCCEKCETPTNWRVDVSGREAYWCGCR